MGLVDFRDDTPLSIHGREFLAVLGSHLLMLVLEKLRLGGHWEFQASLGYRIRFCFEKTKWTVVAHAFNLSTWEAEAGGFLSFRPAWSRE